MQLRGGIQVSRSVVSLRIPKCLYSVAAPVNRPSRLAHSDKVGADADIFWGMVTLVGGLLERRDCEAVVVVNRSCRGF